MCRQSLSRITSEDGVIFGSSCTSEMHNGIYDSYYSEFPASIQGIGDEEWIELVQ